MRRVAVAMLLRMSCIFYATEAATVRLTVFFMIVPCSHVQYHVLCRRRRPRPRLPRRRLPCRQAHRELADPIVQTFVQKVDPIVQTSNDQSNAAENEAESEAIDDRPIADQ